MEPDGTSRLARWNNGRMTARSSIAEIDALVVGSTVPRRFLELVAADPVVAVVPLDDRRWRLARPHRRRRRGVRRADRGRPAARRRGARRPCAADDAQPSRVPHRTTSPLSSCVPRRSASTTRRRPEEIQYLASHAGAEVAIVEDARFLARFLEVRDELPRLRRIYVIDAPDEDLPDGVAPASELETRGSADLAALAAATDPADIATLIYTSGTTGPPKGVMISQYNVVYTVEQLRECLPVRRLRGHAGRVVPADGAHRRADDEPLPAADRRLQRVLLPGGRSAHDVPEGGAPADRLRRAARLREDLQRRQRRARRRPGHASSSSTTASPRRSRSSAPSAPAPPPRSSSTRGRSSTPWRSARCAR